MKGKELSFSSVSDMWKKMFSNIKLYSGEVQSNSILLLILFPVALALVDLIELQRRVLVIILWYVLGETEVQTERRF